MSFHLIKFLFSFYDSIVTLVKIWLKVLFALTLHIRAHFAHNHGKAESYFIIRLILFFALNNQWASEIGYSANKHDIEISYIYRNKFATVSLRMFNLRTIQCDKLLIISQIKLKQNKTIYYNEYKSFFVFLHFYFIRILNWIMH